MRPRRGDGNNGRGRGGDETPNPADDGDYRNNYRIPFSPIVGEPVRFVDITDNPSRLFSPIHPARVLDFGPARDDEDNHGVFEDDDEDDTPLLSFARLGITVAPLVWPSFADDVGEPETEDGLTADETMTVHSGDGYDENGDDEEATADRRNLFGGALVEEDPIEKLVDQIEMRIDDLCGDVQSLRAGMTGNWGCQDIRTVVLQRRFERAELAVVDIRHHLATLRSYEEHGTVGELSPRGLSPPGREPGSI